MVGAYGTFANEGVRNELQSILRIEDGDGTVVEEFTPQPKQVLDRDVTLQISSILSDNEARTPLYGANSTLYFPGRDVAAKTGTTNDKRDAWVLGYTPNLVVGAWAGNNDNSSMSEISGLIITPLWRAFMDVALAKTPTETFPEPPKASAAIKPILRGVWFDPVALVEGTGNGTSTLNINSAVQGAHDILYFVDKKDPLGPQPTNQTDPQFPLWEYPVSLWKTNIQSVTNKQ
jgi:membrane peptidoglycan carboxypeptidase